MSYVAVGVGVGGLALGAMGSMQAGHAAQNAATAQAEMAQQMRAAVLNQASQNKSESMKYADATPEELNALSRNYDAAGTQLDREQRLMDAIDPSLMEASKQALGILRGNTADVNKPMMDMRNSQRQNLVNSLRSQYGPGAENSSIGQKQLSMFDMGTNSMFQQNQQQSLSQLFGIAGSNAGAAGVQQGIAGLQQVGQGYGQLQERKLNTSLNLGAQTLGALSGTSQQMINSAGAGSVGQAMQGQAMAGMGNSLMNAGLMSGAARGFGGLSGGAGAAPVGAQGGGSYLPTGNIS